MHDTYFAAANSGRGFVSFYPELFSVNRFRRVYLIKGGPGTGKSSLMRRAAEAAEQRGLAVRRYLCSSDPDSLDAIVVGEDRFAMIDATAPHAMDTLLPGAGDELIDLGQFWSSSRLAMRREEIAVLNAEKRQGYARVYHWLSAVAALDRVTADLLGDCLDRAKLRRAAERYLAGSAVGAGRVTPALVDSIGMKGRVTLDTMHTDSKRAFVLSDERGGGHIFLCEIARICRERGIDTMQSFVPTDPDLCNAVYLPQDGTAFLCRDCAGAMRAGDKTVNLCRFWKADSLRRVRRELRNAATARQMLMEGVTQAFAQVSEAHFALEQVYAGAMDFAALDAWRVQWIERIFDES